LNFTSILSGESKLDIMSGFAKFIWKVINKGSNSVML